MTSEIQNETRTRKVQEEIKMKTEQDKIQTKRGPDMALFISDLIGKAPILI